MISAHYAAVVLAWHKATTPEKDAIRQLSNYVRGATLQQIADDLHSDHQSVASAIQRFAVRVAANLGSSEVRWPETVCVSTLNDTGWKLLPEVREAVRS